MNFDILHAVSSERVATNMKLSKIVICLVLLSNVNEAKSFRVGHDESNDAMRKAVEDALFTEVKPLQDLSIYNETLEKNRSCAPPLRNQILGTEQPCRFEYWSRPDIHTLGNVGFGGAVHAAMAPLATKVTASFRDLPEFFFISNILPRLYLSSRSNRPGH